MSYPLNWDNLHLETLSDHVEIAALSPKLCALLERLLEAVEQYNPIGHAIW